MREVWIKYNPYKVETQVTIDGQPVKKNSALNFGARRLQEWIESLPEILVKECNTKQFHIVFHGTLLDFEDLQLVAVRAGEKDGISITCEHKPAKEVKDKLATIAQLFEEIRNNPYYEELKDPDVVKAFEVAQTSEFPVDVVATMSSGKSTLINALLGQKLMPAKNEACTATITEIHDCDGEGFHATAYNQDGLLLQSVDPLTLPVMEQLNEDREVFKIIAHGDIPFVRSDDVSLVLVDTPGPNNARNREHELATYRMLDESSKPLVLYILNATQLAIGDDLTLLRRVAESMKVGGKQSKDRFLFVLNKLDDFKKNEDSVEKTIENARQYLFDKAEIEEPNIFPTSALTALDIRTTLADVDLRNLDVNTLEAEMFGVIGKVRKLNENPDLHLEERAPLTPSVRGEITKALAQAREEKDAKQEALIHSGIIPIEAAIRMYVEKYAKTAKIKSVVDTFVKKLESQQSFERTLEAIEKNKAEREQLLQEIAVVKQKIQDGKAAKTFKNTIDALDYTKEVNQVATEIISQAQSGIRRQVERMAGQKLSVAEAQSQCEAFARNADAIQTEVQIKLESTITEFLEKSGETLTDAYRERLASFASEDTDQDKMIHDLRIDPLELMSGDLSGTTQITELIRSATSTEVVEVGSHKEKNEHRKWYKPWTWFEDKWITVTDYADREYVDGQKLTERFFAPVEEALRTNKDGAVKETKRRVEDIKKQFKVMFDKLDQHLAEKLKKLEDYASNQANVEEAIRQSEIRRDWLTDIYDRLQKVLEI